MTKNRITLVAVILAIFAIAMMYLNLRYDPLARNTSVTAVNRSYLLHYLEEEEIRYLVENNIDVDLFYEFIEEPMFQLVNYRWYRSVMDVKPSSPKEIVTFVNAVVDKVDQSILLEAVVDYDYPVLRKLIVDQHPYSYQAEFAVHPSDLGTHLTLQTTIGEYEPHDLTALSSFDDVVALDESLQLRQEAAQSLNDLCRYLTQLESVDCGGFEVQQAYLSYRSVQKEYLQAVQNQGVQAAFDFWGFPSQNEHQLGLALDLVYVHGQQSDDEAYSRLHEIAVSYGFLTYPKEMAMFDHLTKPFHLRYVGKELAQQCKQADKCFYHN